MAKIEAELYGNFDIILADLNSTVMGGSTSATLEESSDIVSGSTRCSIRAYERYSYLGKGRVSMNFTLFQTDGRIFLSVMSTGGSQAVFFKINTIGENSFLDTIRPTVDRYRIR